MGKRYKTQHTNITQQFVHNVVVGGLPTLDVHR
jgi:hypothetical protein